MASGCSSFAIRRPTPGRRTPGLHLDRFPRPNHNPAALDRGRPAREPCMSSAILPYPKPTQPDDWRRQIGRLSPDERVEVLRALLGEPACRQLGIYPLPPGFKLSVVVPVYNEAQWLPEILRRVRAVPIPKEVI